RTILAGLEYELPQSLYGEVLATVITNINDLPTSQHPTLTPHVLVTGKKLDLRKHILTPFGTVAMLYHAVKEQQKFLPRAEMGVILGPSLHSYGSVRAYTFQTGRVVNRSEFTILNRFP